MRLDEVIRDLNPVGIRGSLACEIGGITHDSRQVEKGDVFVCIPGFNLDGHQFIPDALKKGAVALIVEKDLPGIPEDRTVVRVKNSRAALAKMANRFYEFPSHRLKVIGVTGTNGKTTTTHLIEAVLQESGRTTGLIGTIYNRIDGQTFSSERTTPEAHELQEIFSHMNEAEVDCAVMEVSSHAVDLLRIDGTRFFAGILTNITRDHLDYHDTFQDYVECKLRFLKQVVALNPKGRVIINADDRQSSSLIGRIPAEVLTYGIENEADITGQDLDIGTDGASFTVDSPAGECRIHLTLTGFFNISNALAAVASGLTLGISLEDIRSGLEKVRGIPGRLELVDAGQEFTAIVDYAHTPDGLENVLRATENLTSGKKIVVFGCGGDRDHEKRPLMGRVAVSLADRCIVTSDNPRSEDPDAIIGQIVDGIEDTADRRGSYTVIPDRRQAIVRAVIEAEDQDLVLVVGKGHETQQIFKDRVIPFDDRRVLREAIRDQKGEG